MLPLVEGQVVDGLDPNPVVGPALGHVDPHLAVDEIQPPAPLALVAGQRPRHDDPFGGGGVDPRRHREGVVVGEVGDVAGVDEPLAVEAVRLADSAGHEARRAVDELDVHRELDQLGLGLAAQPRRHVRGDVDRLGRVDAREVAVEGVVHEELVAQHPVDAPRVGERAFPRAAGVRRVGLEARERLARLGDLGVEPAQLGELIVGGGGDHRRRVAVLERLAPLGHVVEVGEDLVELLLRDGVELVVVAAGAPQGQAHPHRPRRRHPVDHVLDQELLGDDAALAVLAVVPVEGGGDALLEGRVRHQVARDLLDGELVERHVRVVGVDDPVAVAPHRPLGVGLIAARVGVAGRVEPVDGHPLAVGGRPQHAVDGVLEGVGRVVVEERAQVGLERRQAGQVEARPAQQRRPVGLARRRQPVGLEPPEHEVVDGVARPLGVGHRRHGGPLGRGERPVRLPLGPLVDPQPQGLDLVRAQRVLVGARHDRGVQAQPVGHAHHRVGGAHPVDEQAVGGVAGHDDRPAELAAFREGPIRDVEPQAALAPLPVGPVAREAVLGQDRPDLAGEVDDALGHGRHVGLGELGAPRGAAVDPPAHEVDLLVGERPPRRRRGHLHDLVGAGQPLEQRARLGVAGHDDPVDERVGVEPQIGLPRALARAVTGEARPGQHGPDVPVVLERLVRGLLRRGGADIPAEQHRDNRQRNQNARYSHLHYGHPLKSCMVGLRPATCKPYIAGGRSPRRCIARRASRSVRLRGSRGPASRSSSVMCRCLGFPWSGEPRTPFERMPRPSTHGGTACRSRRESVDRTRDGTGIRSASRSLRADCRHGPGS